jgi:hypothetical protein
MRKPENFYLYCYIVLDIIVRAQKSLNSYIK